MRAGRKSLAQTPAPIEDRVYGSSVNAPNSATKSNANKIVLSDGITNTLRAKLEVFLKDNPDQKGKITLSDLKAVFRRGAGAYSKSHRPTITGGVPNSRNAWAYARVNKFLQKAGGMKVKKAYIQDDDLMKYHLGGDMSKHLAPNGKPSNLTHEQWHLVRTPEFKAWFGDWENDPKNASKVVDSNGEPLVVWRGESNDFNKFDYKKLGSKLKTAWRKAGFYFSPTKNGAEQYMFFMQSGILKQFFLNIKKPYTMDSIEFYGVMDWGSLPTQRFKTNKSAFDYANSQVEIIKEKKHDGFFVTILDNENVVEIVAFEPTQIKLADGTNTTFDGSNPDIRFEDGGETPIFGSVENSLYRGFAEEEVMAYDFPEIYKIAEKHHIGSKTIHTEFIKGVFHEQEHTSDWGLSAHTSLQHLWEVPDYYTKLDAVKLAKGGKVKQAKGDCYETSGRIAIDGRIKGIEFVGKPYLVQSEVRGQGDLMGVRFGHSWIEDDEFVYDYSNGKELKIPKVFYYYLGDIQMIEPRYYRYTFAQAKKKMIETGHYGSWELETESGL